MILRKIIQIVANRCHIFIYTLKYTKFDFGWGSTPWGAYSALPGPLAAWISGVLLLRRGKGGNGRGGKGEEEERE